MPPALAAEPADLAAMMLNDARKAGAEAADVLVGVSTSVSIEVLNGALEQAERSESLDLGLRVLIGRRQACVSSSDPEPDTVAAMAERAVAMAREAPEDPTIGLASADQLAHETDAGPLDLIDPEGEPDPEALQEAALAAEAAARAHQGISRVESAGAGFGRQDIFLAASNGFAAGYARTHRDVACVAITGQGTGMERDYFVDSRIHAADLMSPEEIGRIAAERTLARAGARRPPTGRFPVIYDERISGSLIGHLLAAINGNAVARGASWAAGLLGAQVLPAGIDLIEEPHRPRVRGSRPFDAEGLPTARRAVVENGVLRGWTLDLSTARKLGLQSTANAGRSPSGPPHPASGNVTLTQGGESREELIGGIERGLLITSLIGSTVNPTTGDYSRGAAGHWIENGAIAYPVNECTVAGNLREMLATIRPADDARTHLGRIVPSLAVEGLTIAGA